jgi:hypothetical protein
LATPIVRQKPNIVAPDGGNTTFFSSPLGARTDDIPQCTNADGTYNFFGTSAAAPHAAGVAALLAQAQPKALPGDIYAALENSASDDIGPVIGSTTDANDTTIYTINIAPGFDYDTGFGFIQADLALPYLIPNAVLSKTSVSFGAQNTGTKTTKTDTLTNTGGFPLTITSITVTAPFTANSTCPIGSTLAAGAACNININFAPGSDGNYTGSVSIVSNALTSPSAISISGSGVTPSSGGGAFGMWLLPPGFLLALMRRRRTL